jgi:dolichol-phosphate mannosyltransferase
MMETKINTKEKNFISAVVYVHNTASHIEKFITQLGEVLYNNFENFEIICVNDASTDGSVAVIKAVHLAEGVLTIVNMSCYQNLEASMNAGRDIAIGDFVYEFDSSLIDYEPDLIIDIYRRSLCGFDIVCAGTKRRRFFSTLFYSVFNRYTGFQYKLNTETFRLLSRRAINRIMTMSRTIPYRKALYANCGLKMDTLLYTPVSDNPVKSSSVKISTADMNTAFNAFILFTNVSYKITKILALAMMLGTFGGLVYTIIIYTLKKPVAGYTTTMLVITASLCAIFALLAIIIKYLSILIDLVFKKQNYIVESIERIPNG